MNINFQGQTAIVTGASKGIGKSVATMLVKLKCRVIYTGKSYIPENKIKGAEYVQLDLSDQKSVQNFIDNIVNNLSSIEILINNAGIQIPSFINLINITDWNKSIAVNLSGPMQLIQAVSRLMIPKKYGRILNISSIAGIITKPNQASYSASKSGLNGLTRTAALELAPFNILVNSLCPGTTTTPMTEKLLTKDQKISLINKIPLNRMASPEEIANFALFLSSTFNSYITGQALVIDGGYTIQ